MTAIKKRLLKKKPCLIPHFKERYGYFRVTKANHSILKKRKKHRYNVKI